MQIKAAIEASLKEADSKSQSDSSSTDDRSDQDEPSKDEWTKYLGSNDGPKIEIVIRYPDGKRDNVNFPSTSKLKVRKLVSFKNLH